MKRLSSDKVGHFLAGFITYMTMKAIYLPIASWTVIFLALAKEFYDRKGRGTVELEDILATVLGGFVAFLFP